MEPRPQSSRPAPDSNATRRSPSGAGAAVPGVGGYHQPDPGAIVAPPRADYDYSPLDLAPPGQRRRRQLVAAVLGGLLMMLLVGGIVFAFLLLRDDDEPDDDALTVAAAQTVVAADQVADDGVDETAVAGETGAEPGTEPAGANEAAGDPTESPDQADDSASQSTAGDAAGQALGPSPTPPAQDQSAAAPAAGGLGEAELMAMLPDASAMPQGLDAVTEGSRTQEGVVDALGGSRDAATRLEEWGWSGNAERLFQPSDPAAVPQEATSFISVSVHGFASEQAAAEALPYYSDILLNLGYADLPPVEIGSASRLMVMPQEDGGTEIALYVQDGAVLYRFGGFSLAGDPTLDVLSVASQTIGQ